jgi:hypothetical protein
LDKLNFFPCGCVHKTVTFLRHVSDRLYRVSGDLR